MKKLMFPPVVLLLAVNASSAWGVESTGSGQGSLLVLLFLGICALAVVSQLVPALILIMGAVSGLAGRVKGKEPMALVPDREETR